MKLHYLGTRSKEEFGRFPRTQLIDVSGMSISCDYYDENLIVTEPIIWIPLEDRYDVWQLAGQEVVKGSNEEKLLKTLCTKLIETLYNNGFSSGSFQ